MFQLVGDAQLQIVGVDGDTQRQVLLRSPLELCLVPFAQELFPHTGIRLKSSQGSCLNCPDAGNFRPRVVSMLRYGALLRSPWEMGPSAQAGGTYKLMAQALFDKPLTGAPQQIEYSLAVQVQVLGDRARDQGCVQTVIQATGRGLVVPAMRGQRVPIGLQFFEARDLCRRPLLAGDDQ